MGSAIFPVHNIATWELARTISIIVFRRTGRSCQLGACFPLARLDRQEWVNEHVYHGSNWVVLSCDHCAELVKIVDEDGPIVQGLKNSIQPDEMFVQSTLGGMQLVSGSHHNQDTTYVSWPHLAALNDFDVR